MAKSYTAEQKFFQWILKIYVWLLAKAYGLEEFPEIECTYNQKQEIKIMAQYVVKDDNPDVGVNVAVGEVKDAEGQVITGAQVTVEISAQNDNPDSPSVEVTDNGNQTGSVHFGAPGQGTVNYQVKDQSGKVLAVGSDSFLVTTGDPSSVSSVTATFDGLTPVEEAPVEEPTTGAGEGGTEGGGNA